MVHVRPPLIIKFKISLTFPCSINSVISAAKIGTTKPLKNQPALLIFTSLLSPIIVFSISAPVISMFDIMVNLKIKNYLFRLKHVKKRLNVEFFLKTVSELLSPRIEFMIREPLI